MDWTDAGYCDGHRIHHFARQLVYQLPAGTVSRWIRPCAPCWWWLPIRSQLQWLIMRGETGQTEPWGLADV